MDINQCFILKRDKGDWIRIFGSTYHGEQSRSIRLSKSCLLRWAGLLGVRQAIDLVLVSLLLLLLSCWNSFTQGARGLRLWRYFIDEYRGVRLCEVGQKIELKLAAPAAPKIACDFRSDN